MTPVLLTAPNSVTLNVSQSQSIQFWPTDGNGIVNRTATNSNGSANTRQYGPGVFRHTTTPFTGTITLNVTQGSIYYVQFGADPA